MSFRKPEAEDMIRALPDINTESETMKLLKSSNFWVNSGELENIVLPLYMADEELAYLANIVFKLEILNQQRALIDVMHVHCDEDTLERFMRLFSDKAIRSIMLSC